MKQQATFSQASRGFSWSFLSSVFVLVGSLAAQLMLGRLLSQEDFGVYAIAISCSNIFIVFRDGGVSRWLSRMSRDEFDAFVDQAMALSIASCVLVASIVASASIPVGHIYGQPAVTHVMLVLALALAISPYPIIGLARLHVDLRFQGMAWLKLVSGFVRYGLTIFFAIRGFGPLSFAWPVVVVAIVETIAFAFMTRIPIRASHFSLTRAADVLQQSKWSLFGSFSEAVVRQSDYAVLGLLVPIHVVGIYYFAFQLAMQPVLLFSESLRKIVMPIFSQLGNDPACESRSLRYACLFVGTVATPALLLVAVTADPLLTLLWGTKWTAAIGPLQVLAIAMPLNLLSLYFESLLQSRGLFRFWTFALLLRGVGLGLAAATAAWITDGTASQISWVIAIYLSVSAAVEIYVVMRTMELPFQPLIGSLPVPLVCSTTLAIIMIVYSQGDGIHGPLDKTIFLGVAFAIGVLVTYALFCRRLLGELADTLKRTKAG